MQTALYKGTLGLSDQLRHAGPMAASTLVTVVLGYASFALAARLLTPTDFGLLGALLAVISVVSVALRPLHTTATHVAAEARSRGKPDNVPSEMARFTAGAAGTSLVVLLALTALREQLQAIVHADAFAPLVLVVPLLGATALWQIASGHLLGLQRFRAFAFASIADAVMRTLFMAPMVLLWGVAGSVAAFVSGVILATAVAIRFSGGLVWRAHDPTVTRRHLAKIGGGSIVLTFIVALLQNTDLVLLRTYAPPESVGWYAGAASLGNVWFTVAAPLYLPLYSRVRGARLAGTESAHLLVGTLLPIMVGGAVASVVAGAVGIPLSGLLLGGSLQGAGMYLPLYLAKVTALLTLFVIGQYALATDRPQAVALSAVPGLTSLSIFIMLHPEPAVAPVYVLFGAAAGAVVTAVACLPRL
jgi:O-antigen/teichoic acid export membrane protein